MSAGWRDTVLVCPLCRQPVPTTVDALLSDQQIVCPHGHPLPGAALGLSGLRETVDALDHLIEHLDRGMRSTAPTRR